MCPRPFLNSYRCRKRLNPLSTFPGSYHSGCVGIEFSVSVSSQFARNMETELKQILDDLGLGERIRVERSRVKSPGNNE